MKFQTSPSYNKETNGLTIYVPHYFTKNLSLGDYLNNCEKYESLFFGQKINNELWSNENLQNHFVLSKHLANRIPSDNQMNLTIAKAIISKYGYISKVNKEAKNDVEVDRRSGYDKKSGKIVMSHDPNKVEFAYQKYTSPADIKPLSVFQNLPQKDWQMLAIPLGLFAVGKIAKPVAKPLIENPIKKRGFRFLRNAFLIGPIATYLSFLAFKLSLRFKETEIEDHLRKSNIDHCKAIYEDHEKSRRLYNVYCNLEGFEHLKNNKFYDGDGNFLITYFLVEQWLKMYMNNYTETLPSVRRQEAKDLIQLCYRQELPYIADQFRDEDELTW